MQNRHGSPFLTAGGGLGSGRGVEGGRGGRTPPLPAALIGLCSSGEVGLPQSDPRPS